MPKATLEFDLSDMDDMYAHKRCVKAEDMSLAIWGIVYNVKKKLEWSIENDELLDLSQYDLLDKVYEAIWAELKDHNVDPDELCL